VLFIFNTSPPLSARSSITGSLGATLTGITWARFEEYVYTPASNSYSDIIEAGEWVYVSYIFSITSMY